MRMISRINENARDSFFDSLPHTSIEPSVHAHGGATINENGGQRLTLPDINRKETIHVGI